MITASGQAAFENAKVNELVQDPFEDPFSAKCSRTGQVCCSTIKKKSKPAPKCDQNDGYKCIPVQVS